MKLPGLPKDSRARSFIMIIIAIVVVIGAFLYVTSGSKNTTTPSNVGKVPEGINNVPGGKLSPEYYQALTRANQKNAEEAEMNGQSSMSTLVNTAGSSYAGGACHEQCCSCGENANVSTTLKKLVEEGKMSPQTAQSLEQAAAGNMPVGQYANMLDRLVKEGKLTPAQARKLLSEYKQQHSNQTAAQGAKLMDQLIKSGALPVGAANDLLALQKKGVSPADYAAELQKLVKEGKISPATAARLLAQYKEQHQAQMDKQAAAQLGTLEKTGLVPADAANKLLALQNHDVPVGSYARELQNLVREGKISPETARKLLAQYAAAHGADAGGSYAALKQAAKNQLSQLAATGGIDPEAAKQLAQMQNDNVPVSDYAARLKKLVAEGKLSPQEAARLLAAYKKLHHASGADAQAQQLKRKLAADVQGMVASGQLSPSDAQGLQGLADQNVSPEQYAEELHRLVAEGKLSPAEAKKLLDDYDAAHNAGTVSGSVAAIKHKGLKNLAELVAEGKLIPSVAKKLGALQKNGASVASYAQELQKLVKEGKLSPAEANRLLEMYRREHAALTAANIGNMSEVALPTTLGVNTNDYTGLNMSAPSLAPSGSLPAAGNGFSGLQTRMAAASAQQNANDNNQSAMQARQAELQKQQAAHKAYVSALASSMKAQAGNIVKTFAVPNQYVLEGNPVKVSVTATAGGAGAGAVAGGAQTGKVLVKAGDVEYAVLDTAVNSDYPQSPVMATVVQGKYKGAKLIGTLQTGAGVNADRVILNFTAMSMPSWSKSVAVEAYAVDPKTARSALATSVNHHYLLRYGALFASSFLEGYAGSLTQAGTTTLSASGVIQQTHPQLSPKERIWVGLGQVGTNASESAEETFDMPPTVRVKSGVGIGILFMSDVSAPK